MIVIVVVGIRSTIVVVMRSVLLMLLLVLVAMVLVLVLMRLREDVSISIGRTISILCRIAVMIVLRISRHVVWREFTRGRIAGVRGGRSTIIIVPIRLLLLLLLVVMGAVILFYGATIIGHSTRLFRSIVASWPCDARASSTSSSRITIIPMNGMMFVVIIEW